MVTGSFPHLHLKGEEENDQIHQEIDIVVKMRVRELTERVALSRDTERRLEQQLLQMEYRTYLWLHLAIGDIRSTLGDSLRPAEEPIQLIPRSVDKAYEKILSRVPSRQVDIARKISQIIVVARRPLATTEMAMALGIVTSPQAQTAAKAGLESSQVEKKLRRLCGLFVFINNSKIYLIHQTARDFLIAKTDLYRHGIPRDKTVSPGHIVDDTEDDEIWQPQLYADQELSPTSNYPPHKSYITTNFKHFIKLCEIIQTIIMRLYVGRPRHLGIGRFIQAVRARLNEWFDRFPAEIKLDTRNLPEHCPPPHIFATNVLYRASWILLHRIFIPNSLPAPTGAPVNLMREASATCTAKAEEIYELLKLYSKSFGLRNMMYISTWSIYSAATINAIDFQSDDPEIAASASSRLSMSMYVLEKGISQTPGTRRSIEILKHRLRRPRSTAKRLSCSLHKSSTSDENLARKLICPGSRSTRTAYPGRSVASALAVDATSKSETDSPPPTVPGFPPPNCGDRTAAAPPSFSVSSGSTAGAAISSNNQMQDWTAAFPSSSSTLEDGQSYHSLETDGWSMLYSLLTADDALYSTVEAMGQGGMHSWNSSQGAQRGHTIPGGLGQMDLSQGVMAVPSFIDPGNTQGAWAGYLDDWEG
ncbi:uncharacterized protein N7496_006117 [Penicillium cataractarum]|uniref:Transcription factor domain-containing protein n=1 Tax=Penicillium cataractarum TaxID=2100454 RepID=A0A9W9S162_9EURO|nr:uncharacterized protein N7496_006117 [Penicillium cataractarum]KAJ5370025.1 hypothetical protein N7496_006117 [Penicillium cataractarum]